MLYGIFHEQGQTRKYTVPGSGCVLPYFSKEEMDKKYRDKDFNIIGEIGCLARPPDKADYLLINNQWKIPIHPRGSLIKPLEWVIGYTAVEKNSYLAVVRSPLRRLLGWNLQINEPEF